MDALRSCCLRGRGALRALTAAAACVEARRC
ncbi:hypothetical protein NB717_001498 [Xanthomonas sacchari]|nr:hypothetical protein [Xanthomonas sacchari]MCW0414628.1 hypothetical protein [Xanthomonas sacchari]MCW0448628.1 hypothetical protein [Xanthomonas sacchari]MCW0460430.1 hypothetical protein [Xanthomonas sacchari]